MTYLSDIKTILIRDMVYLLQDWIVGAKLSEKDHDLPGFDLGTFGLAVSIPNHYTI
jgi:hypothetical protein